MGWGRGAETEPRLARSPPVVPSATLFKRKVSKLYGGGSFSGPSSKMLASRVLHAPRSPDI